MDSAQPQGEEVTRDARARNVNVNQISPRSDSDRGGNIGLRLVVSCLTFRALKCYAKNQDKGMSLDDAIAGRDVVNYQDDVPGKHSLWRRRLL